jgi:hypothetical protein
MITTILITIAITVTVIAIFGWLTYISFTMKNKVNLYFFNEAERHLYERIRELEDELNDKAGLQYTRDHHDDLLDRIYHLERCLEDCRNSKCGNTRCKP